MPPTQPRKMRQMHKKIRRTPHPWIGPCSSSFYISLGSLNIVGWGRSWPGRGHVRVGGGYPSHPAQDLQKGAPKGRRFYLHRRRRARGQSTALSNQWYKKINLFSFFLKHQKHPLFSDVRFLYYNFSWVYVVGTTGTPVGEFLGYSRSFGGFQKFQSHWWLIPNSRHV